MAMARWDPFRDLMSIQNELNRLFGRTYAGDAGGSGAAGGVGGAGGAGGSWLPPLDIYETNDRFVVTLELPGVEPGDVDVSVEDATLAVRGERRFYREVDEDSFHRVERRYGSFGRTLTLPQTADVEGIEASFDKGVLTIEVPKAEAAKPKRIEVKATG
jgi:HSP20 family protein